MTAVSITADELWHSILVYGRRGKDGRIKPYPVRALVKQIYSSGPPVPFKAFGNRFRASPFKKDRTRELVLLWLLQGLSCKGKAEVAPLADLDAFRIELSDLRVFLDERGYPLPAGVLKKVQQGSGVYSPSQPSASAVGTVPKLPRLEDCIPSPPRIMDDWYLAIRDTVRGFLEKEGRCPNRAEVWAYLWNGSLAGYGISTGKDRGEPAVFMAEKSLGFRAFSARWDRYTKHN